MPQIVKKLLSALLCVSLTACSSMHAVPDWQRAATTDSKRGGLNVGDELILTTTAGEQVPMRLAAIEAQVLIGRDPEKTGGVRVPFEQIIQVERKELDALKTTLLVVLIAVVGLTAAVKKAAFYPPPP